ncbi:hypothetical protein QUF72_09715 [Desulfobacterales bacterium HSG2]|nr:hypothetical protein [Desulfobacterales bacterium HSG2]
MNDIKVSYVLPVLLLSRYGKTGCGAGSETRPHILRLSLRPETAE